MRRRERILTYTTADAGQQPPSMLGLMSAAHWPADAISTFSEKTLENRSHLYIEFCFSRALDMLLELLVA